jgi:hypothetical protein
MILWNYLHKLIPTVKISLYSFLWLNGKRWFKRTSSILDNAKETRKKWNHRWPHSSLGYPSAFRKGTRIRHAAAWAVACIGERNCHNRDARCAINDRETESGSSASVRGTQSDYRFIEKPDGCCKERRQAGIRRLCRKVISHARNEKVLYPASILVGAYLKERLG